MRKVISIGAFLVMALLAVPSTAAADTAEQAESRVVFSNGGRIVSVDSNGSARKVLTRKGKVNANSLDFFGDDSKDFDRFPEISPDGLSVLFFRQTDFGETDSDFYADGKTMMVKAGGGKARALFGESGRKEFRDATWIPGSKNLLAVKRDKGMKGSSVVEVTPAGKVIRTILTLKPKGKFNPWWGLPTFFIPTELSVSPDGTKFLMTRQDAWMNRESTLEIVNLKTGKRRVVRKLAREGRWSPDGTRITFVSEGQGNEHCADEGCRNPYDVFVGDANGKKVKRVKATHYDERSPSFSPDGQSIAFSANRNKPSVDESREIYRMSVNGKCIDWLTNGTPSSRESDWGFGTMEAPGSCQAPTARNPLVEGKPGSLDVKSWGPRFWLGDSVKGALPSSSLTLFGLSLIDYRDCGEFRRVDCPKPAMVAQVPVCLVGSYIAPALQVLNTRKVRSKLKGGKYRGVRFKTMYAGGQSFAMTFTGQSIVATMQKSGGVRSGRLDQLVLLRKLQPINGEAGGALPTFRVPGYTLRQSRKVKRLVRKYGVNKTAKRLDVARWEVRSQLRLRKNLRQVGPVKPIRCAIKKNVRGLVDLGTRSLAPRAARALEHPAVRNLGRSLPSFDVPYFVVRMLQK